MEDDRKRDLDAAAGPSVDKEPEAETPPAPDAPSDAHLEPRDGDAGAVDKDAGDSGAPAIEEPVIEVSMDSPPFAEAAGADEAPPIMEALGADDAPGKEPTKAADKKSASGRAAFSPFFKKEARQLTASGGLHFLLFCLFGAILLVSGVGVFLIDVPFRLEVAATVVAAILLVVLLYKRVSLETRTGITAAATGLVAFWGLALYQGQGLDGVLPFGAWVETGFVCVAGLVALMGIWQVWRRFHWLPLALSVLVLYGLLAPAWPFIAGRIDGWSAPFLGPDFMASWPHFIRPGFLLAQIILPLSVVLLGVLQYRVLFRPQYHRHWGHGWWAFTLLLVGVLGIAGLEHAGLGAFPSVEGFAARYYPQAVPPVVAPAVPEIVTPAAPETAQPVTEEVVAPVAPKADETAAPDAGTEAVAAPTEAETPASPPEAESQPAPEGVGEASLPAAPAPSGTEGTPAAVAPAAGDAELQARVRELETEVQSLTKRLQAQEQLLRSVLEVFAEGKEQKPSPDVQPPAVAEPAPDTAPAPAAEPAPDAAPAPAAEPAPDAAPAPATEPAPDAAPATGGEKTPGGEPSPDTIPAPEGQAAPVRTGTD